MGFTKYIYHDKSFYRFNSLIQNVQWLVEKNQIVA